MLVYVGLLDAMLGQYSCHVDLMLSHERPVPFKFLSFDWAQKEHVFLGSRWDHVGVYGAYVGLMLIHVRLLETMLGPFSSHVELIRSHEWRVPFRNSNFEVLRAGNYLQ